MNRRSFFGLIAAAFARTAKPARKPRKIGFTLNVRRPARFIPQPIVQTTIPIKINHWSSYEYEWHTDEIVPVLTEAEFNERFPNWNARNPDSEQKFRVLRSL